jgi:hypothetical protein
MDGLRTVIVDGENYNLPDGMSETEVVSALSVNRPEYANGSIRVDETTQAWHLERGSGHKGE